MKKEYLYIFIVALLVRLIFFWNAKPWDYDSYNSNYNNSDQKSYYTVASNLYSNQAYSLSNSAPYKPDNFITPGYPLFLLSIFLISGGPGFITPVIISLVLSAITSVFISYLVLIFLQKNNFESANKYSIVGGLLYSLDPVSSFYSVTLMTENIFLLCFVVFLIALVKIVMNPNVLKNYFYLSFVSGILLLTRPSFLPTFGITVLLLFVLFLCNKKIALVRNILMYILLVFFLVFPWLLRNKIEFGRYELSSVGAYSIYISHVFLVESEKTGITFDEFEKKLEDLGKGKKGSMTFEDMDYYSTKVKECFVENPKLFVSVYLKTVLFSIISPSTQLYTKAFGLKQTKININSEFSKKGFFVVLKDYIENSSILIILWLYSSLFLFSIYSLSIYLIFKMRKRKVDILIYYLTLNFIIIIAMNGLVTGAVRYRIPAIVSLIPIAMLGLAILSNSKNKSIISESSKC
ncbi:MAG: hypothetical protein ACOYN6_02745 [Ignavibacteria bacterium]